MAINILLDPKAPDEDKIYSFDFTRYLLTSESVTGATVTCTVYKGFDPSPQSLISGDPTVAATGIEQLVIGGILNNQYYVKCHASTNLGQELDIIGSLTINQ